jgi:hypothetical protein
LVYLNSSPCPLHDCDVREGCVSGPLAGALPCFAGRSSSNDHLEGISHLRVCSAGLPPAAAASGCVHGGSTASCSAAAVSEYSFDRVGLPLLPPPSRYTIGGCSLSPRRWCGVTSQLQSNFGECVGVPGSPRLIDWAVSSPARCAASAAEVEELKQEGNRAFLACRYHEALYRYTDAIRVALASRLG